MRLDGLKIGECFILCGREGMFWPGKVIDINCGVLTVYWGDTNTRSCILADADYEDIRMEYIDKAIFDVIAASV